MPETHMALESQPSRLPEHRPVEPAVGVSSVRVGVEDHPIDVGLPGLPLHEVTGRLDHIGHGQACLQNQRKLSRLARPNLKAGNGSQIILNGMPGDLAAHCSGDIASIAKVCASDHPRGESVLNVIRELRERPRLCRIL